MIGGVPMFDVRKPSPPLDPEYSCNCEVNVGLLELDRLSELSREPSLPSKDIAGPSKTPVPYSAILSPEMVFPEGAWMVSTLDGVVVPMPTELENQEAVEVPVRKGDVPFCDQSLAYMF